MKVDFNYSDLSINEKINLKSNMKRPLYICYNIIKIGFVRYSYTKNPKNKL